MTTYRPMPKFETGPVEIGNNLFAYLQWNGGWGISNAGFLVSDDSLLVIDALMAPSMAHEFVRCMRDISSSPFGHLINTHSHPDHTNGNQFIENAEIVAHEHCRDEMLQAKSLRKINGRGDKPGWIQDAWWDELENVDIVLPTTTYSEKMSLMYGSTEVELLHYGPAHTLGDSLVYFPESKILFTGDLAFFYAMPLCRGNMPNWVKICEIIDGMDVDLIIPGHGPTGGKRELQDMQEFMQFMVKEVKECFENGMSEEEAGKAIDIGDWAKWPEAERKTMNISNLYSTFQSQ